MIIAAGMSGMPVRGATGLRPALLCDDQTGLYHSAENPDRKYDAAEVDSMEQQGLLIQVDLGSVRAAPGKVVFYIDSDFAEVPGHLSLNPPRGTARVRAAGRAFWFAYLEPAAALKVMRGWGDQLLGEAARRIAEGDPEGALLDLSRSRYCTSPQAYPDARRRMYRLAAQARRALGLPVDPVLSDARLDFPQEAEVLVAERGSYTPRKLCAHCGKRRRWPGSPRPGNPGWTDHKGGPTCPRCIKTCRGCGAADPCEDCEGRYAYCAICRDFQPDDSLCTHLFWSDEHAQFLGSGSAPEDYDKCRASFLRVLDRCPLEMVRLVRRAMREHNYSTRVSHPLGGLGTSFFTFEFCGQSYEKSRDGRSFGEVITDVSREEAVPLRDGVGWLMSLWSGPRSRRGYRGDQDPYQTPAAERRTVRWINEYLKEVPHAKAARTKEPPRTGEP